MDFREQMGRSPKLIQRQLNELIGGSWVVFSGEPKIAGQFTTDAEGREALTGILVLSDAITADSLRRISVTALESQVIKTRHNVRDMLRKVGPLRREEGMTPEDFSLRVAAHYRAWAMVTPNPAAAMSTEWDVKAPTMASWIREARLRGFIPPARGRGKAGRA